MYRVMLAILVILSGACEGTITVDEAPLVLDDPAGEAAIDGASTPTGQASPAGTPGAEGDADGEALFQRYCASCHGPDAAGAAAWPGSIEGYQPIAPIVENGRGSMPAVAITAEETELIQQWLMSLAPDLSALNGEEVFQRVCVTCHGRRGEGTATKGPQLRYEDDGYSEYWTRNGRQTHTYEGDMPVYGEDMVSDAQLDEMFEWLDDTPHPTSGEELYNRYCANCHGDDGGGGPTGKSLRGDDGMTDKIREGEDSGNYANRSEYMSSWSTAQLSDAEVQRIAEYVQSL